MAKTSRARYTLEFKQEAARLGKALRRRPERWAWSSRRCSTGSRPSAKADTRALIANRWAPSRLQNQPAAR